LKALCDTNPDTLHRAAEKFSVENRFDNPYDLLQSEKPNVLGIATRTLGRSELIHAAIEAGTKAIHAEKPLCNSVDELQSLQRLFKYEDVFVTWGAIRRFFSVYKQAVSLANSGRYGALREVRVNLGSAPLYWTHPHSIDLLLFAASGKRIEGVQARLANVVSRGTRSCIESDPRIIAASVYFEGGLAGHITQALGSDFVLSCENAEITVRSDGANMDVYTADEGIYPFFSQLEIEEDFCPTGTLGPFSHLVACLDGDLASIILNGEIKRDILKAQSVSFAMLQSHLEGSRIVDAGIASLDPNMTILARTGERYA
jgi:scyllo-inositol 2-dehydrogenase (NAD+)